MSIFGVSIFGEPLYNSISGTVQGGDIFRDGILGGGTLGGNDSCTRIHEPSSTVIARVWVIPYDMQRNCKEALSRGVFHKIHLISFQTQMQIAYYIISQKWSAQQEFWKVWEADILMEVRKPLLDIKNKFWIKIHNRYDFYSFPSQREIYLLCIVLFETF